MSVRTLPGRVARVAFRERIRVHLACAEALLRLRGPQPGVDPARRAAHLDALRAYWRRGEFPTNCDFPEPTPYFRDADGVRCAVAELAAAEGRADVVDAVARDANHVDLATDEPPPPLSAWLADAALTEEEEAYVQPQYQGPPSDPPLWAASVVAALLVSVVALLGAPGWVPRWRSEGDPTRHGDAAIYHGRDPAATRRQYAAAVALALATALAVGTGVPFAVVASVAPAGTWVLLSVPGTILGAGLVAAAVGAARNGGILPAWALGTAPLFGVGLALSLRALDPLPLLVAGTAGLAVCGLPVATLGYLLGIAVGREEPMPRPSRRTVGVLAGYVAIVAVFLLALQERWVVL